MTDIKKHVIAGWWILLGLLAITGMERAWVSSSLNYPRWLTSGNLGAIGKPGLAALRVQACESEPVEIIQKDGYFVLRCGWIKFMPNTHTYIADAVTI